MFKQRLLTTLILAPLVLLGIIYGNIWMLSAVVLLLMLLMGWEWLSLIPVKDILHQCLFMLGLLICLIPSLYWLDWYLWFGWLVWICIFIAIVTYPKSQRYWGHPGVVGGLCIVVLTTFLSSLYALIQVEHGRERLIYLLFLVWAADIGAYLFGKRWGRHRLIPAVSPGKTLEGLAGGFVLVLLVACGGYLYFDVQQPLVWFIAAVFILFISIIGDLFISLLKRRCHLKDTGHLLPGHGGILDRLDSLIAALPFFYLFSACSGFLSQGF